MTAVSFEEGIQKICKYLDLDLERFADYCNEDEIGGYPEAWEIGSIWEVEGKVLYALTRYLRPSRVVEFGTRYGCSTAHFCKALTKNRKGKIVTVDTLGNMLAGKHSKRVESVSSEGIAYAQQNTKEIDLVFEDGPHSTEFTREVLQTCLPYLNPGGLFVVHDTEHWLVGKDVSRGFREAVGEFGHVLIAPSDCGLGYWRKDVHYSDTS